MLEGPIVHILRNSIDHGIEEPEKRVENGKNKTGVIKLTAIQEHRDIIIEISDDGAGINTEKVLEKAVDKELVSRKQAKKMDEQEIFKLLFHPGFSTKESAGELSGRGVGMDVVLHEVEKIGGIIEVESEKGKGTTFRLKFPVNA
jgi:two-component system chemotaxis sensor kinase CheA